MVSDSHYPFLAESVTMNLGEAGNKAPPNLSSLTQMSPSGQDGSLLVVDTQEPRVTKATFQKLLPAVAKAV